MFISELSTVGNEDATLKLLDKRLEAEAVDACRFRKGSESGKLNVGIRYVGKIRGVCCLVLDILAVVYRPGVYMYTIFLLCTVWNGGLSRYSGKKDNHISLL